MSRSLAKTHQNCASEVQKIKKHKKERKIWQIFKRHGGKALKPIKQFNTEQEAQEYIEKLSLYQPKKYFIIKL